MEISERTSLMKPSKPKHHKDELSVMFAVVCIMDVFGVFPVITLPKAITDCGVYGVFVMGAVGSVQTYTAILLGKCWTMAERLQPSIEKKCRSPFAALAEIAYGTTFSNFVSLLVNVTIFCGGIPNLIVASQNLQLLGERLDIFHVSFCYWIIITGVVLCPILWLGSPKDMKLLCSISVTFVILVFLLVIGCLIFSPAEDSSLRPEHPSWELIFISYGIITFQYDIHPNILSIQVDMREKSKLNLAVASGFVISLAMSGLVTVISATKYGLSAQPSLLDTIPTAVPVHFAALFAALQLCLSLAVSNSALFQHAEDCMGIDRTFSRRRCILRTTLTLLAVLIAESVPRFDLVMSLVGGALTGPLAFILPPLFYLKISSEERKNHGVDVTIEQQKTKRLLRPKLESIFCVAIILTSIVCTVATTYVNVKSAGSLARFTQPCVLNISATLIKS